jgi:NAD(P)-dependent dehydrogenase (short-subunit alcohol dehydrogenase family)
MTELDAPRGRLHQLRTLIVGGGSGIGRAVMKAFREHGAFVAVLERDCAKCAELENSGLGLTLILGDAGNAIDAKSAVDLCVSEWGGLDVLVNCVGVFDFYRPLGQIESAELPAAFDEIFRTNVLSQLVPARAALEALRASRGSLILTVSSSGFYPGRGGILYVASKFAVRGCVISLAHELAPEVRVNGVAPGGVIGTDLRGAATLGQTQQRVIDGPKRISDLQNLTPLRVAMTAPEIAGSYVFLASAEAAGMTGEILHPDGGMGVRA